MMKEARTLPGKAKSGIYTAVIVLYIGKNGINYYGSDLTSMNSLSKTGRY